jgi:D-galactarolactone cycloisomerase
MLAAEAVDVVQPSVAKIGGVTELWKAMTLAGDKRVRAVPHTPFLGPALVAVMHVISALPDPIICEHRFCDLEAHPLGDCVVARDGILQTPAAPGLGFDLDEGVLASYRRG